MIIVGYRVNTPNLTQAVGSIREKVAGKVQMSLTSIDGESGILRIDGEFERTEMFASFSSVLEPLLKERMGDSWSLVVKSETGAWMTPFELIDELNDAVSQMHTIIDDHYKTA